jgi:eukaryotic-like serine/threonine-protein kinase
MALVSGTRVGRYEVRTLLGAGGMGEVYRAFDPTLHRDVALKVLPQHLALDPERVQRFTFEATAAGRLNHPHILTVYDAGVRDGVPFIVSELLIGETLRTRLERGPMPPHEASEVTVAIAQALAAAHASGIVHRDLKPENVFLTTDRGVKVLDFGLAKLLDAAADVQGTDTRSLLTKAGVALGTVGYMAPEQVRGESVDHRVDVFALGALIYEMLSGRRAFAGPSSVDTLHAILHDDPPAVDVASDTIALRLLRTAHRCLRKKANERYQSVQDLAHDLQELDGTANPAHDRGGITSRRAWPVAVAVALACASGGLYLGRVRTASGGNRGSGASARISSVAVLPLENLSHDPDQEYFSDGMTDAVIADLSQIGALRVISRTSVMRYKGARTSIPEIARELGVDGIVEGSVLQSGNRVRITATLVAAAQEHDVWAHSYEGNLSDVLALQRDVAASVAREVQVVLTPEEDRRLSEARRVDPRAHSAYLRGRHALDESGQAAKERAIELFHTALDTDPQFAPAYVGIADAYLALQSNYLPPRQVMPLAKAAAMKALELDPTLPEAHSALGFIQAFYEWDRPSGEASLKRALAGKPGLAVAHDYYALLLGALGRHDEAQREATTARTQDPFSLPIMADSAWVAYLARRYNDQISESQRAIALDAHFSPAYAYLALGYEKLGRFDDAIATLEKGRQIEDSSVMLEMLGGAYASAGRPADARRVLDDLQKQVHERYICPYEMATVYAGLGDRAQTLQWLKKGVEQRADCMPWMNMDPKLDLLRQTPEFKEIERQVGFGQQ